jgi:uncharacterized protein (TIGR02594 family)
MNISTYNIQKRLAELGFDPGPNDGIRGRRTIAAIKAFQKSKRLVADGIAGPKTAAKLFDAGSFKAKSPHMQDLMPWLDEARRKLGLHERRDRASLMAWLRSDGRTLGDPAKLPWCGDFVETAIATQLPEEPLPANPYLARNWLKFGKPCTPQLGAVLVFWRGSRTGVSGHVGFYVGETATHYRVLGGNQRNAVTDDALIAKPRLLGARWPLTALPPGGQTVAATGGIVSTNEA